MRDMISFITNYLFSNKEYKECGEKSSLHSLISLFTYYVSRIPPLPDFRPIISGINHRHQTQFSITTFRRQQHPV